MIVAVAAPLIPYFGINSKFITILIIALEPVIRGSRCVFL
jgi:hypothetical protein